MKKMRKCAKPILAVMLIMSVIFAMAVPSFAAENKQTLNENTINGNSTVWYQTDRNNDPDPTEDPIPDEEVKDNYTVTIPENILATKASDDTNQYTVKAEDVLIHPEKKLDITCTYSGEMAHHDAAATKLTYKMQNNSTDFTSGAVILSVAAGAPQTPETTSVCAVLTAAPLFAGVYEGIATFACAVVDAA